MLCRPVDTSGDILPVTSSSDLLSGISAAVVSLRDYLRLFQGEWWENPARGNPAYTLLSTSRLTAGDTDTVTALLTDYLLSHPAVQAVSDAQVTVSGTSMTYSAAVTTLDGEQVSVSETV